MCFWYLERCATESRGLRILLITFSSFDKRLGLCHRLKESFYIPCKKKKRSILLFKVTWISLSSTRLHLWMEYLENVTSFIRCYRREIVSYSSFFNIHAKEKLKNLFVRSIVYFSRCLMTLSYARFANIFETTVFYFLENATCKKCFSDRFSL